MERWSGRVAVVTGASVGIGAAIAQLLVKKGMKVVGLARRAENIQVMAETLKEAPGKLFAVKADITKEDDILAAFKWVKDNLGGVDVLVNNAGVSIQDPLSDGNTDHWRQLLDLNVMALTLCTREALRSMKERGVDDGHIIHINSVAGHYMLDFPGIAMYSATKHAVSALTEGLRKELVQMKTNIRVTSISPGVVNTDMVRGANLPEEAIKAMPMLQPEDIADAVVFAVSAPARVQDRVCSGKIKDLKNQLEIKDTEVKRLTREIEKLKYELEENADKLKYQNRAMCETLEYVKHEEEIAKLVGNFYKQRDWSQLSRGLENLLGQSSEVCRQAKVVGQDDVGRLHLWRLSHGGHTELALLLLCGGVPPNASNIRGNTMLHGAAAGGHLQLIKLMLYRGAYPNIQDANGWTSLMWAAHAGHLGVVKFLVQAGLDTALNTFQHETALSLAESEGRTEVVQYLEQFPH